LRNIKMVKQRLPVLQYMLKSLRRITGIAVSLEADVAEFLVGHPLVSGWLTMQAMQMYFWQRIQLITLVGHPLKGGSPCKQCKCIFGNGCS
jgi:hypothetical protein